MVSLLLTLSILHTFSRVSVIGFDRYVFLDSFLAECKICYFAVSVHFKSKFACQGNYAPNAKNLKPKIYFGSLQLT